LESGKEKEEINNMLKLLPDAFVRIKIENEKGWEIMNKWVEKANGLTMIPEGYKLVVQELSDNEGKKYRIASIQGM
jgi:hypothetical protein